MYGMNRFTIRLYGNGIYTEREEREVKLNRER